MSEEQNGKKRPEGKKRKKDVDPFVKAKESALLLLRYRDRSIREMESRLRQKGYEQKVVEKVIGDLKRVELLDDKKFALMFSRSKINAKKWGPAKLRNELLMKGITGDLLDTTIEEVYSETDQETLAAELLARRLRKRNTVSRKDMKRHTDFLRRRGFNWEVIKEVIANIKIEGDYEA